MSMLSASPKRVAAVVVTYNRKDMLAKCLEGLIAQEMPVKHIYIVNNCSTDGTKEFLEAQYANNSLFTLCHMPVNTGGAGGFNKGLELAVSSAYDWYWLMDDDVVPDLGCLSELIRYSDYSRCLHPRKKYYDGTDFPWFGKFDPASGRIHFKPEDAIWKMPYVEVNYGCFEGMLVSREIVEKIGLPDKEYFISYDDRIYGYLASKYTKVLYVRDALMTKLIKKDLGVFSEFSFYYRVRNLFLLRRDLRREGTFSKISWMKYVALFIGHNVARSFQQKGGGFSAVKTAWKGLTAGISYK